MAAQSRIARIPRLRVTDRNTTRPWTDVAACPGGQLRKLAVGLTPGPAGSRERLALPVALEHPRGRNEGHFRLVNSDTLGAGCVWGVGEGAGETLL